MKRSYLLSLLLCAIFLQGHAVSPADSVSGKYKLVWSDEFDYTGLPDATKWSLISPKCNRMGE